MPGCDARVIVGDTNAVIAASAASRLYISVKECFGLFDSRGQREGNDFSLMVHVKNWVEYQDLESMGITS